MRLTRCLRYITALSVLALPAFAGADTSNIDRAVLSPASPRAARSAVSAPACSGLKDYEITRQATVDGSTAIALCSMGSVVTGGSCSNGGGAPMGDGSGWRCPSGGLATAICAAVCSSVPAAVGACCVPEAQGSCLVTTFADCVNQIPTPGGYIGDGVTCEDPVASACFEGSGTDGACCFSGTCIDDVESDLCESLEGVPLGAPCDSDEATEQCCEGDLCATTCCCPEVGLEPPPLCTMSSSPETCLGTPADNCDECRLFCDEGLMQLRRQSQRQLQRR